jgi:hypothetical protein
VFLLKHYSGEQHVNVGSGSDLTIADLAQLVCAAVGFEGEIVTDPSKPDGTPRKLMSGDKLAAMGWKPRIELREGIADAYRSYLQTLSAERARARSPHRPDERCPRADSRRLSKGSSGVPAASSRAGGAKARGTRPRAGRAER